MPRKNEVMSKVIADAMDFATKVSKIIDKDSRYDRDAYAFIMGALHYTLSKLKKRRHISGEELSEGIREYGLKQYGPMTRTVLESWGIQDTSGFGDIVFRLVDVGLMRKRPEDTEEAFKDIYDFESVFDEPYRRSISPKIKRLRKYKKE